MELPERDPCEIISTQDVANMLQVTTRTVQRWCGAGKIKATRLGKEHAILWRDFMVFWNEYHKKLGSVELEALESL